MIAAALILEPFLLIADEPTTALDVTTQAQILRLIRDIQAKHDTGVLFITHDLESLPKLPIGLWCCRMEESLKLAKPMNYCGIPKNPIHEC